MLSTGCQGLPLAEEHAVATKLIPILPAELLTPEKRGRTASSETVNRLFPDDGSLWESVRLRWHALLADFACPEQRRPLMLVTGLTALLIYSYWPGLLNAKSAWNNPQYSHGWIVPLFSAMILFWWRQPVATVPFSARVAGLGLLLGSLALRLFAARYRIVTIDMYTFVPALAGAFLLGGGWSMFRWAWGPIGFLIFMYPLPDEATRYLLGPLQTMATAVSTYAIQTLGIDAIREGNQIIVGETQLGVVDACSGLRMLTIFVALSMAIVMLGDQEWYESIVILASAFPIALVVNATRITVTGVMYTINPELAERIFHDWAGYFMMPLALGLLYALQKLLAILFVPESTGPVATAPVGVGSLPRYRGTTEPLTAVPAGLAVSGTPFNPGGPGRSNPG